MKITTNKLLKYLYTIIFILWILVTLHVLYLYVDESSGKEAVKGGTFVEGTTENIVYLPYISSNGNDKFFQSFLFNGCTTPYVTGTNIRYKEDLCNINTQNRKNYEITVKDNKKWNDGTDITIEDIYFTYNNIISENKRNISELEKFENVKIEKNEDSINVIFPTSSKDNTIFFTNYILPKEYIKGKTLNQYIQNFGSTPVGSNCGRLKTNTEDSDSVVFNLENCQNTFIKYYQAKSFSGINSLIKYQKNPNKKLSIDSYIGNKTLSGFNKNKVILNDFVSVFFNVESSKLNSNIRRGIASLILSNIYNKENENYFIKDNFLFNAKLKSTNLKKELKELEKEKSKSRTKEIDLKNIPDTISGNAGETDEKKFKIETLDDKVSEEDAKSIDFEINGDYEKISVTHNNGNEYFLQGYSTGDDVATYNISKSFQNLVEGKNKYEVRGYINNQPELLFNVTIYYKDIPTKTIEAEFDELKLKVLYYKNRVNNYLVKKFKEIFRNEGINKYFAFTGFNSESKFKGSISSKDYDIVIRGINMGLKKDISNIFLTSDPNENPSQYSNSNLASNISQYFISDGDLKRNTKKSIDNIYKKEVPLIIIGKKYGNINISKDIDFSYPKRLYNYWMKKDFLTDIKFFYKPNIDTEKIFNLSNFIKFINKNVTSNS